MEHVDIISHAERLLDGGDLALAHALLAPLALQDDPHALFLCSQFSISPDETEAAFEARSLRQLERAAELGLPAARYALAIRHDVGDMPHSDPSIGAALFKQASDAGHLGAMFCHGRNLYFGAAGLPMDAFEGMRLMRQAADRGHEDAQSFLDHEDDPA